MISDGSAESTTCDSGRGGSEEDNGSHGRASPVQKGNRSSLESSRSDKMLRAPFIPLFIMHPCLCFEFCTSPVCCCCFCVPVSMCCSSFDLVILSFSLPLHLHHPLSLFLTLSFSLFLASFYGYSSLNSKNPNGGMVTVFIEDVLKNSVRIAVSSCHV